MVTEVDPAAVDPVVSYVVDRTGLSMDGPRRAEIRSRIAGAVAVTTGGDASEYRRLLERNGGEFQALVDILTIGETYFFREPGQLAVLRDEVLPERAGAAGGLRVWSAGCATGPEAYTLAFLVEEAGLSERARILATDLSERTLDVGRAGVYGRWSLRAITDRQRATYFEPVGQGFAVRPCFRRNVDFRQQNLLEPFDPRLAAMDVVMCRNVLIYLTRDAVDQVARRLVAALKPGGWLFTAAADPHLEVEGLETVVTTAGLAYRRGPGRPRPARPARPTTPRATAPLGQQARRRPVSPVEARRAPERPDPVDAAGHAASVRALGDSGDLAGAVLAASAAIEEFPTAPELRFLHAVALLEAGQPAEAAEAARAAVYLDPTLAVAHLVLGRAEAARQNRADARRSFRNAAALLDALPAEAPVALAEGETAGRLAAIARGSIA